ncbi:MAG: DNA primase [Geobacter sp.]|nr:DNA primase [Geobacter sp.]
MNDLLTIAREYAARGISVIPVRHKDKKPSISWKKYQQEHPDDETLVEWFSDAKMNIGIVTGSISGITVVDFDTEEAIADAAARGFLTEGPIVLTSKGLHAYCKYANGHRNFQKNPDLPGIDLRGEGGYVVAPPSIHESGHIYAWLDGRGLDQPLPEVPEWILIKPENKSRFLLSERITTNRNDNLFRYACSELASGIGEEDVWGEIQEANRTRCYEPLDTSELKALFDSALKYKSERAERLENLTDFGNAERLVRNYGHLIRYVPEFKKWLVWAETRWITDSHGVIDQYARATVRKIIDEANTLFDEWRNRTIRHSLKSERKSLLDAMVGIAKTMPGIPIRPSELDTKQDILNVLNGCIDLTTGTLCPHNPADLITKISCIDYDPSAECPIWINFLNRVMDGNESLIRYIQKSVGYSLTGSISEQCIFIPHGSGANGKSIFIGIIEHIMGDYSIHCSSEDLMVKNKRGGANNEIARLRGARFVAAVETDEGNRFSESLVKTLTGGDTITARFLYGEHFEFSPTFKIWLACNHKPVIRGNDHAIWRRIKLIPFNVTIPDHDQDKHLAEKLKAESAGILAWAVQGCLLWQQEGLKEPSEVVNATSVYRTEMDSLGTWIEECCDLTSGCKTQSFKLYENYKDWTVDSGEENMSARTFGIKLVERGFEKQKMAKGAFYIGIGIKKPQPPAR